MFEPPLQGGALFVDVALGPTDTFERVQDTWRSIAPSVLEMCSQIVLRSPVVRFAGELEDVKPDDAKRMVQRPGDDWPADVDDLVARMIDVMRANHQPTRAVHVIELPLDGPMRCSGDLSPETVAACRAIELDTLLRRTNAIWHPTGYHYRLPSGEHTDSFVRIADVFSDRRAAAALASWLRGVTTDSTVVVLDNGTLVPLVDQLALWLERAALQLPLSPGLAGVEAFDRYPRSRFQYLRQFRDISDVEILAILSVSSSGHTYDLLAHTLEETAQGHWRAECLVSRSPADQATAIAGPDEGRRQAAWLTLGPTAGGPTVSGAEQCPLCRDTPRARVVRIDPRTFSAMVLPEPERVMPDILAAARNASLFEHYSDMFAGAPPILLAPTEASRVRAQPRRRGEQRERVRFEPLALLARDDVGELVGHRLVALRALPERDRAHETVDKAIANLKRVAPIIAVCDAQEVETLARALALAAGQLTDEATAALRPQAEQRFLAVAQAMCPSVASVVIAEQDTPKAELARRLGGAQRILLLVAGLQTGVTLQHLVVQVQDAVSADPMICGLVLHAHPHDSAAWRSVRNTFGGQHDPSLLALWLTYLPAASPFGEEYGLLDSMQDEWLEGARFGAAQRWRERMAWTSAGTTGGVGDLPTVASPLWSTETIALRRTSRYGRLDDRRIVAAMGAALTESLDRHEHSAAPEWVQVDLPNALRSYFDALLHVALLRWVSHARAWWGAPNECASLIDELAGRFRDAPDDWHLLLAELLLAAAIGKLPEEGVDAVLAHADTALHAAEPDEIGVDGGAHRLGFVELGAILVRQLQVGGRRRNPAASGQPLAAAAQEGARDH